MKTNKLSLLFLSLVVASLATSSVWAKKSLPDVNDDGLVLIKNTKMAAVYSDPDADLGVYTAIMLKDASVTFKKNWKRNYNTAKGLSGKVKDSDMERIKEDVATSFRDAFTTELSNGGYQLVDAPGEFVLLLKPSIVDLDVYAPDIRSASRRRTYSESTGEMTLNIELYDSLTNDKIGTIRDRKRDLGRGFLEWRTRSSNKADTRRVMHSWAKSFLDVLDKARTTVNN